MKALKNSRAWSFVAVTLVYIIATLVGLYVYRALALSWWLALLIADVVATLVTFVFSLIFGNASVYDPYWSVQPPVLDRTHCSSALFVNFNNLELNFLINEFFKLVITTKCCL